MTVTSAGQELNYELFSVADAEIQLRLRLNFELLLQPHDWQEPKC